MTSHEQSLEDWVFKSFAMFSVVLGISSMVPQIVRIWKTKKTNDLSIYALYILFLSITSMQIYAFYFNLWEIFFPNIISLCFTLVQIMLKKCYDTSELELGLLDEDEHQLTSERLSISPLGSPFMSPVMDDDIENK